MIDFFSHNYKKDSIVIFYNGLNEKVMTMLPLIIVECTSLLQIQDNKNKISFGTYDVKKNSHEVFKPLQTNMFLRVYQMSNLKHYVDFEVKLDQEWSSLSK